MRPTLSFPIIIKLARILTKDERTLPDSEIAALQCVWENIDYSEFERDSARFAKRYSKHYRFPEKTKKVGTLNSSASRILKIFSDCFDRKLTRNNFRRNLQELWNENKIDISELGLEDEESSLIEESTKESIPVVNQEIIPALIERESDIKFIEDVLEQYPIIIIYAPPGIGKTTFSKLLGKYIEYKYNVYYSDLRYINDFRQWGYELLSQAKVNCEIDNDKLYAKLSESLGLSPSLVFIDSVAHINQEFSGFLENISLRNNQSARFILISTQKIKINISRQYVYYYPLRGLKNPKDINDFFKSLSLKSPSYWEDMNQFYEGNFRQIIYASDFINDFFDGDVEAYWKSNSRVFSPDISQKYDEINFSPLDMDIFSMFSKEDNVISLNIVQALNKDSRTSEIWSRINYLCDLGYLNVERERGTQRLAYTISPMLKDFFVRENKI